MLFQLTTAGRALINSEALLTTVTKVEFGDAYNYVPDSDPNGLSGTKVYETTLNFSPIAVDTNNMRFTTLIPANVSPFSFGEVALWSGSTLLGIGSSNVLIQKTSTADYRLDIYVDLLSGQRFASWEVVSSFTRNFFPRVQSPDLLIPPAFDTNNAYVVFGDGDYSSAYLAFSDTSGRWSFSGKNRTWFYGTVSSVSAYGLNSDGLDNAQSLYFGTQSDLVIQFTDGKQRGVCRKLSTLLDGGCTWSTQLLSLPSVGDSFVVLGPSIGTNFNGDHETLSNLHGGKNGEHYHLKQADHDRIVNPHFTTTKTVSASAYSVLDTDNDAYITLTAPTVTVTLDDDAFTEFPVGGMVMFRYIESDVTVQVGGSTHIDPVDMIAIPVSNGTFALVKKANGLWDYISTVDVYQNPDGNVRHKYPEKGGSLSQGNFVPMYAPNGDDDGPITDLTSSPLSLTENGGMRIWSGSMNVAPKWDAPALILIGVSNGVSGGTATGLANNTTAYTCTGLVNNIPFSISIPGNAAQTYTTLIAAFNAQLWAALGSNTIAALSYNGYGLILETLAAGSSQSIVLTGTNIFDNLANLSPNFRISANGATNSISSQGVYLNFYDNATNNNRVFRAGFGATVMGFQNSASGQSGYSIGGAYNLSGGAYSGIVGGTTNRVGGSYVQVLGGYGNTIVNQTNDPVLVPQVSSIVNSVRSAVMVKPGVLTVQECPIYCSITVSEQAFVFGRYSSVNNSRIVYADGFFTSVFASQNVTTNGSYASVSGSQNVTVKTGSTNTNIVGSTNITVGGSYVNVAGVRDLSTDQSSVNYLPNSGSHANGKPGLTFQISTSAYGSGSGVVLTTDALTTSATNRMVVPMGAAWFIDALVIANYATGFKTWKVKASLKNVGGAVTITYVEVEDFGGTNGAYMTVDLAVGTGVHTDKVHFLVNTRNDTNSGYQTVSASALATVVSANALS